MLDIAAKIALAPLLVAQGLHVRRQALKLPEASGGRTGETGDGPRLRLLIVGDSSAAGVGAAQQSEALAGQLTAALGRAYRVEWRLIARTGATTAQTRTRLAGTAPDRYDVAVTALGVNDVTRAVPLARWLEQQTALRKDLSERFGVRLHVASGLPPMGDFPALPQPLRWILGRSARRYDAALAQRAKADPSWQHVRFHLSLTKDLMATDGFHPGPQGYALWGARLAEAVDIHLAGGQSAQP